MARIDGSSERRGADLAAGLGGLLYNPEDFKHLDSCLICLEDFKDDLEKKICRLKCDERHYFHLECI